MYALPEARDVDPFLLQKMAPAKPPSDDDDIKPKDRQPLSPHHAPAANKNPPAAKRSGNNGVTSPANRKVDAGQTLKPAVAAPTGAGVRKSSATKKPVEPTLLGDFLLGRPSAARQAAARRKSLDANAVRQELRQQMREHAVRRVPRPGGVQSRVKDWQKNNAAAMALGNPEDAASEPTEVAVHVDADSVTEEDRVRIKWKQKPRRKSGTTPKASSGTDDDKKQQQTKAKDVVPDDTRAKSPPKSPPKKRIVSDDNWMKRNKSAPASPRGAAATNKTPPAVNKPKKPATMQEKIKEWAMRVDVPDSPSPPEIPKNVKPAKEYATKCGATITVEEDNENSSSVRLQRAKEVITVEEDASNSSQTWRTETARSGDDGIRVTPIKDVSPHGSADESLRVKPTRRKHNSLANDGIRVRPIKHSSSPQDDGIRVRPLDDPRTNHESSGAKSREKPRRLQSARRDRTPTGRADSAKEPEGSLGAPNARPRSRGSTRTRRRATAPAPTVTETCTSYTDDDESWTSSESDSQATDRPSSAPGKSLADVPFGYSAFSELELPVGADHHHFSRPKPQRRNSSSFNVVPKAFKKIMTGAKEIVHERVDPPKPIANQPPSIENWLSGTVDPFVEKTGASQKTPEDEQHKNDSRNSPDGPGQRLTSRPDLPTDTARGEVSQQNDRRPRDAPLKDVEMNLKSQAGLKRSKATRVASFPQRHATAKTPLRETLNNLFRGESSGHKIPTKAYSSYQDIESDSESSYVDHVEQNDKGDPHVRSLDPHVQPPSPESSYISTDVSSNTEGPYMTSAIPRRRPPPAHGHRELSTIVSEASESTIGSDSTSVLSESTVTQTTALTRSTAVSRRQKGSGLKRRLTKHSDLVSVLSLPDDDRLVRTSSIKSTSSLRRRTSNLDKVTVDDLLEEFAIDEDLYRRELKTLVDGAVPVLLSKVVHGSEDYAKDLFGAPLDGRADTLGKAVVNMGVALEKLKNLHKWAPLHDVGRILTWVLTAYPVYDKYLDVWRLGFEGIIVNLAPGRLNDEDSLVNAMPRNEDGDVVDAKGQPVDLQRLLTRPLARIRGLLKLMRVSALRYSDEYTYLVRALNADRDRELEPSAPNTPSWRWPSATSPLFKTRHAGVTEKRWLARRTKMLATQTLVAAAISELSNLWTGCSSTQVARSTLKTSFPWTCHTRPARGSSVRSSSFFGTGLRILLTEAIS